ncbi:conserved hypothetical protein, partial [Ricinus communis]
QHPSGIDNDQHHSSLARHDRRPRCAISLGAGRQRSAVCGDCDVEGACRAELANTDAARGFRGGVYFPCPLRRAVCRRMAQRAGDVGGKRDEIRRRSCDVAGLASADCLQPGRHWRGGVFPGQIRHFVRAGGQGSA